MRVEKYSEKKYLIFFDANGNLHEDVLSEYHRWNNKEIIKFSRSNQYYSNDE
jgi:hypothetical protein